MAVANQMEIPVGGNRSVDVPVSVAPHVIPGIRTHYCSYEISKRVLDLVVSLILLALLSPVFLFTSIAVWISSRGPILFRQQRVGRGGRVFTCYKFRSMVLNAEQVLKDLQHLNEVSGPVFKMRNDPRMTPVGRLLRKFSLDELPQLWNVVLGDMSLVGPRPPVPDEVAVYNEYQKGRLVVKPGITCIWQVSGRSSVGFDQWMDMDHEYINNMSFMLDVKILLKTIPAVLTAHGAQ